MSDEKCVTHHICGCRLADLLEIRRLTDREREYQKHIKWLTDFLVRKKSLCPCGGIILADTENWDVPLCDNCYSDWETRNE